MVSSLVLLTNAHELQLARFVASQGMPHDDCWHPLHSSKSASNSRADTGGTMVCNGAPHTRSWYQQAVASRIPPNSENEFSVST